MRDWHFHNVYQETLALPLRQQGSWAGMWNQAVPGGTGAVHAMEHSMVETKHERLWAAAVFKPL